MDQQALIRLGKLGALEPFDRRQSQASARIKSIERMDQIKYAVLERSGGISIIPIKGA